MLRTSKDANGAVLDRDHRLVWRMCREATARTVETAGWPIVEEFRRILSREPTDSGELLTVGITANKRECELIQE